MNPYECEFLARRILEGEMKDELLREDECQLLEWSVDPLRVFPRDLKHEIYDLLQRLVEEREKNKQLLRENSCIDDLESEIGALKAERERLGNIVLGEG